MFNLSDYQYDLPESLIAQEAVHPAHNSKLLVPIGTSFHDHEFIELPKLLTTQDVLFFNDTKVVKARVPLINVFVEIPHHQSASRNIEEGEIFFLELHDHHRFEGLVTLTKRVRQGSIIHYNDDITFRVEELTDKGVLFQIEGMDVLSFFETYGQMPLPPYISYAEEKEVDYQTAFAKELGSVAAPTASLHFTPTLLETLKNEGIRSHHVTLHVGLGTFKPVDTEDIRKYHIHEETIIIDESMFHVVAQEKLSGNNIIAIGTTVARTLETLPYLWKMMGKSDDFRDELTKDISLEQAEKYILSRIQEGSKIICQTKIFIYPGFERKIVDGLVTNFHLPGSTLLMLVASFVDYENIMKLYEYAIDHDYRFFSFGDGMFLRKYKNSF